MLRIIVPRTSGCSVLEAYGVDSVDDLRVHVDRKTCLLVDILLTVVAELDEAIGGTYYSSFIRELQHKSLDAVTEKIIRLLLESAGVKYSLHRLSDSDTCKTLAKRSINYVVLVEKLCRSS